MLLGKILFVTSHNTFYCNAYGLGYGRMAGGFLKNNIGENQKMQRIRTSPSSSRLLEKKNGAKVQYLFDYFWNKTIATYCNYYVTKKNNRISKSNTLIKVMKLFTIQAKNCLKKHAYINFILFLLECIVCFFIIGRSHFERWIFN